MNRFKIFLLLVGDVVAFYASLFAALIIRYGNSFYAEFADVHAAPFTIVLVPWLIIFYVAGLYDLRRLRNTIDFTKTLLTSIAAAALVAILLFYLVPAFGIAPKTNLIIFLVIVSVLELFWRQSFNRTALSGNAPDKVILVGNGPTAEEIVRTVSENPQLGYAIVHRIAEQEATESPKLLEEALKRTGASTVIVPRHLKRDSKLTVTLYALFGQGILVADLATFYERIMRKLPLADLEETWFLENIEGTGKFYDPLKRAFEIILALAGGIILLPVELLIAILVKLTSRGPVLIRQKRVGRLGEVFTLYKFRSMVALSPDGQAETQGAQWAAQGDKRVTPFGKFIRATHLDELPQFINLIKGDISFVGPRPERPEFVEKLKEQVPYYEVRLLVKPGVTGWAGINHRADLSIEDVQQKLQYDIYYLKNRSLILDCAIILKTIKLLFINPK